MTSPSRREIRTCSPLRSIWQPPVTEEDFRTAAVELALATKECPIEADIGLGSPAEGILPDDVPERALRRTSDQSRYSLSLEIEHRLANDFALIAATQEAVFSVTAAAITQHASQNGYLDMLTLRLAANEGISQELKEKLVEIWDIASATPSQGPATVDLVFEKIIQINRTRILQRIRKAVGHPPVFRERGRTRTNPDDKLLRAFARMSKEKPTSVGRTFIDRATVLNAELLTLLETVSVDDAEGSSRAVLAKLGGISKRCFDITTLGEDGQHMPFKHLLKVAGLNQQTWLKNKHVAELDKIGAYWRIAQSLTRLVRQMARSRPKSMAPVRLVAEGVQPYVSIMQGPSIQGRDMACYVHAEVQLLTHYLAMDSTRRSNAPPPRVIGASKSACVLCYLFINCHGTFRSPPTHGRLYDQWTIPDLMEYSSEHASDLRSTIVLMLHAMLRAQAGYCLKKPRDFPMTSRTDLERLSIITTQDEDNETTTNANVMLNDGCENVPRIVSGISLRQGSHGLERSDAVGRDNVPLDTEEIKAIRPPSPPMSLKPPLDDGASVPPRAHARFSFLRQLFCRQRHGNHLD